MRSFEFEIEKEIELRLVKIMCRISDVELCQFDREFIFFFFMSLKMVI